MPPTSSLWPGAAGLGLLLMPLAGVIIAAGAESELWKTVGIVVSLGGAKKASAAAGDSKARLGMGGPVSRPVPTAMYSGRSADGPDGSQCQPPTVHHPRRGLRASSRTMGPVGLSPFQCQSDWN